MLAARADAGSVGFTCRTMHPLSADHDAQPAMNRHVQRSETDEDCWNGAV